jgi:nucleotide-binding universal stress UspA family protein
VYASVIVGVDGSESARRAVRVGATVSAQAACPLVLVHVRDPLRDDGSGERCLDDLLRNGPEARIITLTDSNAAAALLEHQEAHPDSLLCLGTRAASTPSEVLLGSCAARVLRATERLLLLAGPRCCVPDRITTVLSAYDGTSQGDAAAHTAAMWSFLLGAELHLVRVAPPGEPGAPHDEASDLVALAHELKSLGLRPQWDVLHGADAAVAIADYGRTVHASVTVIGHTDHALPRRLLGVTTADLVRISSAPVLVARKTKPTTR